MAPVETYNQSRDHRGPCGRRGHYSYGHAVFRALQTERARAHGYLPHTYSLRRHYVHRCVLWAYDHRSAKSRRRYAFRDACGMQHGVVRRGSTGVYRGIGAAFAYPPCGASDPCGERGEGDDTALPLSLRQMGKHRDRRSLENSVYLRREKPEHSNILGYLGQVF